jgi:hypothetical protein
MPPFLMLIAIVFVVIMVVFGHNPLDEWRAEQEKYGRDPLVREINKFNEEKSKKGGMVNKYKPPPGATVYRLPPNQMQIAPRNLTNSTDSEQMVRPAPDVPITQWGSSYPAYMLPPKPGTDPTQENGAVFPRGGATSLMPGARQ